ncbi:MAG: hypothetical protein NT072_09505 [Deltaproteobacteria bacterium]|nr:hypothetical protein [Deltaproteobacteria bacterium]
MRAFHAIQKKGFTVVVMLIIFGVFMVMQPVTAQAGKGGTPEELQKQIDELKAQVATLTAALDAERAAREAQDTYLLGEIDAVTVPQSLLDLAPYVSVNPDAMNEINGPNVVFSGVNVHIQSGAGYTWDYSHGPLTGLGNLIMGYNELRGTGYGDNRSGSHNIVLGVYNNFSSYGGLVGGNWNTISGKTSSVLTGNENAASGECSIVFGGEQNTASAYASIAIVLSKWT